MNRPVGGEWRAAVERLAARLEAAVTPAERAGLQEEILRLTHEAEAAATEIAAAHKMLVALDARHRQLTADLERPPEGISDPTSAPVPAPAPEPARPIRADHLGASTFIEKGWSLIAAGDHAGAITALGRALELVPGDPQAQALLGWALMLAERYDDALAALSRVLALEPHNALARVNLGFVCLRKGIFGEAIEHLSRVLRDAKDRKAILYANYYLGLVYLERGMYGDAQSFFRQALVLGPNLHEASYDLGRAQWFAGERDGARATWRQAVAAGRLTLWGQRCAELLAATDAGGEVPR